MNYFTHEYVSKRIIRIIDVLKTAAYLIIGDKKACLIDTCNGLGNLKEYVETLTQLPYDVVLTHGHFDHAGAASLFQEVYMNPKDIEVYHAYINHPLKQQTFKTLPKEITDTANKPKANAFLPLHDQQIFDLGNISVEMIEVLGHTPGMMMALIPEEKVILFGDACGESVLIFDDFSSSISEYRNSLFRIKNEYSMKYNKVLRNHGTFTSDVDILNNVIECCNDILAHTDDHYPLKDPLSKNCYAARKVDKQNLRIDGKHGNVVYRIDKVK